MWLSAGIQNSTLSFGNDRKTSRFLLPSSLTYIKEFDSIPHQLLTAKLSAYGFDIMKSVVFISAYLKNQKPKTKVGFTFSKYLNILFGVPEGTILGPVLFPIFITDVFYLNYDLDIASYGKTPLTIYVDMTLAILLTC